MQATIDQSLEYIESQQNELGSILTAYEDQITQVAESLPAEVTTVGPSADEEREKT